LAIIIGYIAIMIDCMLLYMMTANQDIFG